MSDPSIRALSIAEQAEAAARRFILTGEAETNPYAGTVEEERWRSQYECWLLKLTAPEGSEGSA